MELTDTILWKSEGIWNNGHARTITKHGGFDPDDPKTEVRAGTGRKWVIPGTANACTLSGNQSRIYTHFEHDGSIYFLFTFAFLNNLVNFSTESFSDHDEGGDKADKPCGYIRFGGVTVVFFLDHIESKVEYFHQSDKTIKKCKGKGGYTKGQKKTLKKKLVKEKKYPCRVNGTKTLTDTGATFDMEALIDYNADGNYVSVAKFHWDIPLSKAPGVQNKGLYCRLRTNSKSDKAIPKDIPIENVEYHQLS